MGCLIALIGVLICVAIYAIAVGAIFYIALLMTGLLIICAIAGFIFWIVCALITYFTDKNITVHTALNELEMKFNKFKRTKIGKIVIGITAAFLILIVLSIAITYWPYTILIITALFFGAILFAAL